MPWRECHRDLQRCDDGDTRSGNRRPTSKCGRRGYRRRSGLTDAELDRVKATTLQVGSAAAGTLTVTADLTCAAANDVKLVSGGDVVLSADR